MLFLGAALRTVVAFFGAADFTAALVAATRGWRLTAALFEGGA